MHVQEVERGDKEIAYAVSLQANPSTAGPTGPATMRRCGKRA